MEGFGLSASLQGIPRCLFSGGVCVVEIHYSELNLAFWEVCVSFAPTTSFAPDFFAWLSL